MTVHQFAVLGSLAAGDRKVFIAQGVLTDDLPPGAAGFLALAERVRCQYGERYGDSAARWIELHIWETDLLHHVIREWHLAPRMGTPDMPPLLEATR